MKMREFLEHQRNSYADTKRNRYEESSSLILPQIGNKNLTPAKNSTVSPPMSSFGRSSITRNLINDPSETQDNFQQQRLPRVKFTSIDRTGSKLAPIDYRHTINTPGGNSINSKLNTTFFK